MNICPYDDSALANARRFLSLATSRLLIWFGMVLMALLVLLPSKAQAYPHTVHWVSDDTANHISGTTLYVNNMGNCTFSGVSGGIYLDGNAIKAHEGNATGYFTATYTNAGYNLYGQTFNIRMTVTVQFPDSDHPATEGMQVYAAGGGAACSGTTHVAMTFKIEPVSSSGAAITGTFGIRFEDLDVMCADNSLYDEGVELVSNCGTEIWVGEAMTATGGHKTDYDDPNADPPYVAPYTDGERMDVYDYNGHTIINASHLCGGKNDSSFSCIGSYGATFIWRGGNGLGSAIGIRSSTTIYPSSPAPTKATSTPTIGTNGSATFTISKWFPDVVASNQANSITVTDTFAKCFDVSQATVTVQRTDQNNSTSNVTGNWTKSVNGQTLTLTANNTGHGYATLSHVFTISVPVRKGYTFEDSQLTFSGTNLALSNTANVKIVPKSGSQISQDTGSVTVQINGYTKPYILLQKADPDLGTGKAQGNTTMAGARYTVQYWNKWDTSGDPYWTNVFTTNANGELVFNQEMHFGTYRITETTAPNGYGAMTARTVYVKSSNASGNMTLTTAGSSDWGSATTYGATTASTGYISVEPSIAHGGVSVAKVDADSGSIVPQGDAGNGNAGSRNFAGTTYQVINKSTNPVYIALSKHPYGESSSKTTYQYDDVCFEIVANAQGTASLPANALPYGSYLIKETVPAHGYLNSGWAKEFSITSDGQVVTYDGAKGTTYEKNFEPVQRGAVTVEKVDKDDLSKNPQGNAPDSFAGTTYRIVNRSDHYVIVDGTSHEPNTVAKVITADENGKATTGAQSLPYGRYQIYESHPIDGYLNSGWTRSFVIDSHGQVRYYHGNVESERNEDPIKRGGVRVEKVDYDRKDNMTQGDASSDFSGTEYGIYNLSAHYVYVDGVRYEKSTDANNPVLVKTIVTDSDGVAKTDADCLPYGTYLIKETQPVEGYLNSGWNRTFTILDNGQIQEYKADVATDRNEDPVIRGGISISKVDFNSGSTVPQGDAGKLTDDGTAHTFAGTTYRIRNKSDHSVYIRTDDDPFDSERHLYGQEVCMEIVADENGIASTGDHALPYGTYFVQEAMPAIGYENSSWGAEFQIRSDGQMISFDDEESDSETRQNYEPIQRGGVSVAKVDADWLLPETQGDANGTFAGTQYQIRNASASYVCVDGTTYNVGDVVKTITTDETGVATTGNYSLPYGTYTIKETAATTGYLINSAWEKTFTIREHGYMQYYRKEFESERVEDSVIRGGLEIHKYDADTKQPVPQGESRTFAGTKYVIRTLSSHDVHIKGDDCLYVPGRHDYGYGDKCAVLTSGEDGVARLPADTLPYGTYEVMEVEPPAGYLNSYWKKTFSIRNNGAIVTFDDEEGTYQRNEDPIAKGSVTVSKVDAETGYNTPQGNASLEGAEYSIVNTSDHSVVVDGHTYASGATCMVITSDARGTATSGTKELPYGTYSISETKAPTGYKNSGWSQSFTINHDGNEIAFIYSGNKNYESIERLSTGIQVRKQDASYSDDDVSGSASLAGAVFAVRNASTNPVFVNGVLHPVGSVILHLVTDADGYAYIVAGTLPYGSYEVTEESVPTGYLRNSTWVGTFDVNTGGTPSLATLSCPDPVIRGDVKFRKVEAGTQRGLPGIAFKITSVTTGESHIAITDSNGLLDTSSAAASRENGTANANDGAVTYHNIENIWTVDSGALDGANGIWFNGRKPGSVTPSNAVGALPYDTYEIEELRCDANRDYELVPPFRITITTEGYALASETIEDPRKTPPTIPGEHGNRVTIYKTADPAPNGLVSPGQVITYSVLARNTGADIQHKTLVRDYIPEGTEYVTDSISDNGAYVVNSGGQPYVEWRIDDLLPRSEKTVTFQVKVLYDAPQYIKNTGYVKEMPTDFTPGDPDNPMPTEESNTVFHRTGSVQTPAFVRVIKSSEPVAGKQVAWKTDIKYTLTVENTGGTTASMIGVYDRVPYGTELVSYTQENDGTVSGTTGHQGVGWLIPTLEATQTVTLEMVVRVVDRNAVQSLSVIQNQASWGDQSNLAFPRPPSSDLSDTTNIVEHPLYEAPSETSDTYKDSLPKPESVVSEGQQIHYTLTTTNSLARVKPYVLVRDYIPEHTSYVANSASDGGVYVDATAAGNTTGKSYVEWVLTNLAPRASKDVTFDVTVSEGWDSYIRNIAYSQTHETALVAGDTTNPEPTTRTNELKHRTSVSEDPEDKFPLVRVVKSSNPLSGSTVVTDQEITYYLDVTNDGQATAYGILVFDAAPDGTRVVSIPSLHTENIYNTTPAQVNGAGWLIKQLGIGESVRLSFTVKVTGKSGIGVIRNQAKWHYDNVAGTATAPPITDAGMTDASNIIEHLVATDAPAQHGAYVTCYKDANPKPNSIIKAGDEIEYIINATNTGKDSQEGTLVRDYVPDGTEYVQGSATADGAYVPASNSTDGRAYVEWVIRNLAPQETKKVSFKVSIADGYRSLVSNSASFSECGDDARPGDPGNLCPAEPTNVVWHTIGGSQPTPAVVQVVKDATPPTGSQISRDENIRYILRVTNTGQSPSEPYGVYDAVPTGLVAISESVSGEFSGTLSEDGSHVAWLIPRIDPGQVIELSYEARLSDTATRDLSVVENQASWGKSDKVPDAPLGNTSNIVQHIPHWLPRPSVTKEVVGNTHLTVGDEVTFSIKARNDGEAPMLGWTLTDEPPSELSFLSDSSMAVLREDGTLLWRVDLQPGEEKVITLKMQATKATTGFLSRNTAILRDPNDTEASRSSADVTISMPEQGSPLIQTGSGLGTISGVIGIASGSFLAYELVRRRKTLA